MAELTIRAIIRNSTISMMTESVTIDGMRKSNIELLRIVAMLFIIAHHLLVHGVHLWEHQSFNNFVLLSLDSVFFIGVNVFVLISGYCCIKFRFGKIVKIWLTCAIVGTIGYFVHLIVDGAHIGRSIMYNTIFSISNAPGTWYIKEYIFLMLISPLLNNGLERLSKPQFVCMLVVLSIINVYFGWFWQNEVNTDGYNLNNFIYIYSIGYYIGKYNFFSKNRRCCLIIWLGVAIVNTILLLLFPSYTAFAYNNPLVIVGSVSFFLFFVSFDFYSRWVNIIAASCLGVYLIHENCYISQIIYGNTCSSIYSKNIVSFIISVLLIFAICTLLDFVIQKTLLALFMNIYDKLGIKELFNNKSK